MYKSLRYIKTTLLLAFLITAPLLSCGQCNNDSLGGKIKIITWNIYMLPRHIVHTGQLKRAQDIVEALKAQDADIIVFEEAFDKQARAIIRTGLRDSFPYESGDPRKNVWWKTNCGVWILSKVPIEVVKQIFFKEARGSDRFACKGAILLEGVKNGFCFQLIGTHLQSDINSGKNVQPIRDKQYAEIKKELLVPYSKENIPQIVAGDFNTIQADSSCYNHLVGTLKLTQCAMEGKRTFSYDYSNNDFITHIPGKPQLIDYIFYSKADVKQLSGTMHVVVFRKRWDSAHKDLSDHFAVAGTFSF